LEFLFPGASSDTLNLYQSYVRKLAHLTEYGVLGFLIARMFRSDRASFLSRYWIALSVALVALVAALDEWRQSFLASRTASLYDVVIDLAGGSLAVLIFWLYYRRRLADQFIDL
jgi:VanZ family protein